MKVKIKQYLKFNLKLILISTYCLQYSCQQPPSCYITKTYDYNDPVYKNKCLTSRDHYDCLIDKFSDKLSFCYMPVPYSEGDDPAIKYRFELCRDKYSCDFYSLPKYCFLRSSILDNQDDGKKYYSPTLGYGSQDNKIEILQENEKLINIGQAFNNITDLGSANDGHYYNYTLDAPLYTAKEAVNQIPEFKELINGDFEAIIHDPCYDPEDPNAEIQIDDEYHVSENICLDNQRQEITPANVWTESYCYSYLSPNFIDNTFYIDNTVTSYDYDGLKANRPLAVGFRLNVYDARLDYYLLIQNSITKNIIDYVKITFNKKLNNSRIRSYNYGEKKYEKTLTKPKKG